MKKIVLIGASDHCRYTIDIIEHQNKYEIAGILDLKLSKGELFSGYKVLGYLNDLKVICVENNIYGGIVAIGDNYTRMKVVNEIKVINSDFNFINAIHPSTLLGKEVKMGKGIVIMAGVIVNNNTKIGSHCFLATKSSLDHDSSIGDFSSISAGVTVGGGAYIGHCSAIAIGATIFHYKRVGNNTVIGGNALVNKDIGDNVVAYGVPAKIIRVRETDEKYL